jgi:hypothetical protein
MLFLIQYIMPPLPGELYTVAAPGILVGLPIPDVFQPQVLNFGVSITYVVSTSV